MKNKKFRVNFTRTRVEYFEVEIAAKDSSDALAKGERKVQRTGALDARFTGEAVAYDVLNAVETVNEGEGNEPQR